jgi:hypothetical protein
MRFFVGWFYNILNLYLSNLCQFHLSIISLEFEILFELLEFLYFGQFMF